MSDHVRSDIRDLAARPTPVTREEYEFMRMNSYEREVLVPRLSDEALIVAVEQCLKNCGRVRTPAVTYNDAMVALYGPELLRRLKERKA